MVMLSAAIRDLQTAHPGCFAVDVRTPHPDLWRNNPHLTAIPDGDSEAIEAHYPLIQQSNQGAHHFVHAYRQYLETKLGVVIPQGAFRGDIHLTAEEKSTRPIKAPYWVIGAGGKRDFTAKWWDPQRWQAVVNHFAGKVKFVQVGDSRDVHPALSGVIDMRGKTSLRDLIVLIHHSAGVLCHVTSFMHLSAALPLEGGRIRPCVVVAGGREPSHWERYPGHAFLDTIGQLPCCASGGCWKARVVPGLGGDHDKSLCTMPVEIRKGVHLPECLNRIQPADVITAMERFLAFSTPSASTPCRNCGAASEPSANQNPAVWGPAKWREFHARAGTADKVKDIDTEKELRWLANFAHTLPCPECRLEIVTLFLTNPPRLQSADAYRHWGIEIHNGVNARIGKPVLTVEAAEQAIEDNRTRNADEEASRRKVCIACDHYQKATETTGPVCRMDGAGLRAKIRSGKCPKWTGGELERHKVGVVIGTFGAVPYIHLQLESLRRFHPGTPCLVVDDGSPQRAELEKLCEEYGAEFIGREKRMGHIAGDLDVFLRGIEWAKAREIELLVKLSRRFIPSGPWIDELRELHELHNAPTYNARCERWGFGFRSECVAMCVADWEHSTGPIVNNIPKARLSYLLAEAVVHDCAGIAWRARNGNVPSEHDHRGYIPWPFMGTSKAEKSTRYLWHETHSTKEYKDFGRALGIEVSMDTEKHGILVRRTGALGDVLCITPILAELRKRNPGVPIDVATAAPQALDGNKDITGTFPPHHGGEGYETVIDLNNAYENNPKVHIVAAYAAKAGIDVDDWQVRFRERVEWKCTRAVYLHCAKSWTSRTLPKATWEAVAKMLKAESYEVFAIGTHQDFAPESATDLRGKLTLHEIKERIDKSAGFIGSDSGLLHLAGATGAPIVGIYTCASHTTREPVREGASFAAVYPALSCYGCLATFTPPVNDLPECRRADMACVREIKPQAIVAAFLSIYR